MKKLTFIISLLVIISSFFCICTGAVGEAQIIEAQEIYTVIPDEYEFSPYYEEDLYFTYIDGDYNCLYIDIQENKYIPQGISALSEEQIKERIVYDFVLEGDDEYISDLIMDFDSLSIETINGVKMCKFICRYTWKDDEIPSDELVYSSIGGYVTATEENIYYLAIYDCDEVFNEDDTLNSFISSTSVNGTLFSGDKADVSKDFSSYKTYAQVLSEELSTYWANYEDTYGEDFYTDIDTQELAAITKMVGIILAVCVAVPTIIIALVAVILMVKYSKNKKRLDELQRQQYMGAANAYLPNMAQGNPQPYNTQPVADTEQK